MSFDVGSATLQYLYVPAIEAPVAVQQQPRGQYQYRISERTDSTTVNESEFDEHYAKLKSIATDSSLWLDGSEPPEENTLRWAQIALQFFELSKIEPIRVVSSAEGGVAICCVEGDKYADIEFLNSGVILGVVSNKRDRPVAWEIESSPRAVSRAVVRIREFISGR
jgi:hypothetical protein